MELNWSGLEAEAVDAFGCEEPFAASKAGMLSSSHAHWITAASSSEVGV